MEKMYQSENKISDNGMATLLASLEEREEGKKIISQPVTLQKQIEFLCRNHATSPDSSEDSQQFLDDLKTRAGIEQKILNGNLFDAIQNNNVSEFKKALNRGADRNVQRAIDNATPLITLIEYMGKKKDREKRIANALTMFRVLFLYGSSIKTALTDNQGRDALSIATYYGLSQAKYDLPKIIEMLEAIVSIDSTFKEVSNGEYNPKRDNELSIEDYNSVS